MLGLLNLFSGGGLGRIALFALGIMPYITASIILQILQVAVPSLEKLSKEGEVGQQRITQYTRYLTVGLAFAQSIGYVFLFRSFQQSAGVTLINNFNLGKVFIIVLSLTAGTMLLMWLGELVTQRGIGNGISLLIFASIVSRIPGGISAWWRNPDQTFKVIMPFIVVGVVAAIVFVQLGQRRIPIQYAKRVIGRRMTEGGMTYLPLQVNMAGVIPVIFAASIMAIPPTIGQLLGHNGLNFWTELANFFNPEGWHYVLGEIDPHHPDDLLLHGGHVQPRRPGRQPAQVRRLHPRGATRQADRRVPGPHPGAIDAARCAVPGRDRGAADDPHQPDECQLLLRRHLDPDRDRRCARHDAPAGGAVDDAQLRRVPQVGTLLVGRTGMLSGPEHAPLFWWLRAVLSPVKWTAETARFPQPLAIGAESIFAARASALSSWRPGVSGRSLRRQSNRDLTRRMGDQNAQRAGSLGLVVAVEGRGWDTE